MHETAERLHETASARMELHAENNKCGGGWRASFQLLLETLPVQLSLSSRIRQHSSGDIEQGSSAMNGSSSLSPAVFTPVYPQPTMNLPPVRTLFSNILATDSTHPAARCSTSSQEDCSSANTIRHLRRPNARTRDENNGFHYMGRDITHETYSHFQTPPNNFSVYPHSPYTAQPTTSPINASISWNSAPSRRVSTVTPDFKPVECTLCGQTVKIVASSHYHLDKHQKGRKCRKRRELRGQQEVLMLTEE